MSLLWQRVYLPAFFLLFIPSLVLAGPGAHGPNGEHLDEIVAQQTSTTILPTLSTHSDDFELFAQLQAHELSVFVDRYASNEPILHAQLELEFGSFKAQAKFRADNGDYVFDDPNLIKALSQAGRHALLFTLVAEAESDLLDGQLPVVAAPQAQTPAKPNWPIWAGLIAGLLLIVGAFIILHQRGSK